MPSGKSESNSIPEHILNRKGATTTAAVPAEVRTLLSLGQIESVNLSEWLVVDQLELARITFEDLGWESRLPALEKTLTELRTPTAPKRIAAIGGLLAEFHSSRSAAIRGLKQLQRHRSDTVRAWACFMAGKHSQFTLAEKLQHLRPFADDDNMGVREMAWMAVRDHLAEELEQGLALLLPFVTDESDRLRRFASELTRPRGVWCRHIGRLKESPQIALHLLEPLRADPSKYVRDSVANWLNDASKSQPDWVRQVCRRWSREAKNAATESLVRRALRTIRKADTSSAKA